MCVCMPYVNNDPLVVLKISVKQANKHVIIIIEQIIEGVIKEQPEE